MFMSGFDIEDTIVVRRIVEKGTKIIEETAKKSNWAGQEYKEFQKEKMKLAGDIALVSSKGTGTVHLGKILETQIPSTKGRLLCTSRGTGIRLG
jgi:hypothetical protein